MAHDRIGERKDGRDVAITALRRLYDIIARALVPQRWRVMAIANDAQGLLLVVFIFCFEQCFRYVATFTLAQNVDH